MGVGSLAVFPVLILLLFFWDWLYDPYRKRSRKRKLIRNWSKLTDPSLSSYAFIDDPDQPFAVARAWDRHLAMYKLPPISQSNKDIQTIWISDRYGWYWTFGYDNAGHLKLGYQTVRKSKL